MQNINKIITPSFPLAAGVTPASEMTSADMNNILGKHAERADYLYSFGIYPHDVAYTYPIGAFCQSGGTVYKAKTINTNQPPETNADDWDKCAMTLAELQAMLGLGNYLAVSQQNLQNQTFTTLTTTGTAPTYIGSVTPAPASLVAGLRLRASFHSANSGAASTLNLASLGAKPIRQYDSTGALVDAVLSINQLTDIEYNGTAWVVLDPLGFSRTEADARYVRLPNISRAFTAGSVLTDMPSPNVDYTVQTLAISGASNIRVQGHAAFANSSTTNSVGVTLQIYLNSSNQFGGHYLGANVPMASANNQTQIPISVTDRKLTGLNPATIYTITLVARKTSAIGPAPVLDAYLDVEYS